MFEGGEAPTSEPVDKREIRVERPVVLEHFGWSNRVLLVCCAFALHGGQFYIARSFFEAKRQSWGEQLGQWF